MRKGVLLGALLVACASGLPHPPYVAQSTSALSRVERPPPPARVEVVPAPPSPEAVWIDGEWVWRRALWAWLPGRWVMSPPGSSFSVGVVVRRADGTLWSAPGAWHDADGGLLEGPPPLALASVQGGAVFDADGNVETTGPILRERPHATPAASSAPAVSPAPPAPPASPGTSAVDAGLER